PEYAYSDRERDAVIEAGIAAGRKDPRPRDGVQRVKGLGEMNATELWDTTMNPANRGLLPVTPDDPAPADRPFSLPMGGRRGGAARVHPTQRQGREVPRHLTARHPARRRAGPALPARSRNRRSPGMERIR